VAGRAPCHAAVEQRGPDGEISVGHARAPGGRREAGGTGILARACAQTQPKFAALANGFSNCTSYAFDLQAYDVMGSMAYTAGLEHTSVLADGRPGTNTLRATQVYRRESGEWRVAHRHADPVTE
jgi:ketosteroid isomerase-like protein